LQELQESVVEISTSNIAAKQDRDKYKDDVGDCPDSEQLAVEILAELKRKGVTVNRKTTKENIIAETNTGKDIESEVDRNDLFGAEEGFGEETAEETERNTANSETESVQLQIIKPPENTSEVDEILMENVRPGSSTTNTNLTINSSSTQGQHRFDLQVYKNSTTDGAERVNPAHVTIQIIPRNISLQLGKSDHDPLLGLDLHNFAAIIQNSDSTVIQQRSQPTLAVVHETGSNDKNNTRVTQTYKDETDTEVDVELGPDVNATLHGELNYINGTFVYNQSENSDVAHGTDIQSSGKLAVRNEEILRNSSSKTSEPSHNPAITILVANEKINGNLSITVIKQNGSTDTAQLPETNIPANHSSYNKNHSGQNFNISDKEYVKTDGTISTANIIESSSNSTDAASQVPVTGPLKRTVELGDHEEKGNITIGEFWRVLQLAKRQLDNNGKNDTLTVNDPITFTQNSSGNQDPERAKHTVSTIFSTDAIQNLVSATNDTEDRNYGIQRQRYLSRLQELATELVSRANGSSDDLSFTNTTDEIRDITSDEGKSERSL
jgi:hypothetical protein